MEMMTLNCPVCEDSRMREVEKDGVLIDVCPSCKGVWLDRGELDKLMLGMREMRAQYDRMQRHVGSDDRHDEREYRNDSDYSHGSSSGYDKHGRPYKKKNTVFDVFGDLFD